MNKNVIKVIQIDNLTDYSPSFSRRDLYRICIVTGNSTLYFGDQKVVMSGTYLFLGNVNTPYSWVMGTNKNAGYSCLFTKEYLQEYDSVFTETKLTALFKEGTVPLVPLTNPNQISYINFVFERIVIEIQAGYTSQKDVIKTLLQLILFEALRLWQEENNFENREKGNAAEKAATAFLSLLSSQFPIEDKNGKLIYKNVSQYAGKLSVHPNYLNRMVKEHTGKTALKLSRLLTKRKQDSLAASCLTSVFNKLNVWKNLIQKTYPFLSFLCVAFPILSSHLRLLQVSDCKEAVRIQ